MGNLEGGGGRNPENVVTIVKGRPKWENSRYRGDKGEKQILYWLEKPYFWISGNGFAVARSLPNIRSLT